MRLQALDCTGQCQAPVPPVWRPHQLRGLTRSARRLPSDRLCRSRPPPRRWPRRPTRRQTSAEYASLSLTSRPPVRVQTKTGLHSKRGRASQEPQAPALIVAAAAAAQKASSEDKECKECKERKEATRNNRCSRWHVRGRLTACLLRRDLLASRLFLCTLCSLALARRLLLVRPKPKPKS